MTQLNKLVTLLLLLLAAASGSTAEDLDVVIVGAGYAGLSAATSLPKSLKARVYEGSSRVGGRVRNWDTKTNVYDVVTDDVVEVGGTFISPSHTALIALGKSVGINVYNVSLHNLTHDEEGLRHESRSLEPAVDWPWWWWGQDVIFHGASNSSAGSIFHSFDGTFMFKTPKELVDGLSDTTVQDLVRVGKEMDLATASLEQCESPTSTTSAWFDLDSITFEGWIRQQTSVEESRVILRNMCRGMIAQEPNVVSFLSIVKSMHGCWSGGDDDQYRFRGGSQAPLLRIQQQGHVDIVLQTPVRSVSLDDDGMYVVEVEDIDTGKYTKVRAKYVIVTGSPSALSKIRFDGEGNRKKILDANEVQLLQRMPMGSSMKYFLIYDSPWWRSHDNKVKLTAIYATKLPKDLFPVQNNDVISCQDHRPYSDDLGAMMCWIEGAVNVNFYGMMNAKERRDKVLSLVKWSFHNDSRALTPIAMQEFNWADQEYIGGAYTGYFTPGTQSSLPFWKAYSGDGQRDLGEKSDNLWFAGADWWTGLGNGYMEGAVRHGAAVAHEIEQREGNIL